MIGLGSGRHSFLSSGQVVWAATSYDIRATMLVTVYDKQAARGSAAGSPLDNGA
jgi:hypothetical protein